MDKDGVRALPCPRCAGACWACGPSSELRWVCGDCMSNVDPMDMPFDEEERLISLLDCFPYHAADEQTLRSILARVDEDLGGGMRKPSQHFLRAWLLAALVKRLLADLPDTPVQCVRPAAERTLGAFWHLEAWMNRFAPECVIFFAQEYVVPMVRGLLAVQCGKPAAALAGVYEAALAVILGPTDPDVRLFGHVRAGYPQSATGWVLSCAACGKCLPSGSARRGNGCVEIPSVSGSKAEPPGTVWCQDCGLAPFCGPACETAGHQAHASLCCPVRPMSESELKELRRELG